MSQRRPACIAHRQRRRRTAGTGIHGGKDQLRRTHTERGRLYPRPRESHNLRMHQVGDGQGTGLHPNLARSEDHADNAARMAGQHRCAIVRCLKDSADRDGDRRQRFVSAVGHRDGLRARKLPNHGAGKGQRSRRKRVRRRSGARSCQHHGLRSGRIDKRERTRCRPDRGGRERDRQLARRIGHQRRCPARIAGNRKWRTNGNAANRHRRGGAVARRHLQRQRSGSYRHHPKADRGRAQVYRRRRCTGPRSTLP